MEGSDTSRREDDDDDSQAPTAWCWRRMRTAFVGMVDDAATFGVLTDDPHAKGGEDGEECKDKDGGHECDCKRNLGG